MSKRTREEGEEEPHKQPRINVQEDTHRHTEGHPRINVQEGTPQRPRINVQEDEEVLINDMYLEIARHVTYLPVLFAMTCRRLNTLFRGRYARPSYEDAVDYLVAHRDLGATGFRFGGGPRGRQNLREAAIRAGHLANMEWFTTHMPTGELATHVLPYTLLDLMRAAEGDHLALLRAIYAHFRGGVEVPNPTVLVSVALRRRALKTLAWLLEEEGVVMGFDAWPAAMDSNDTAILDLLHRHVPIVYHHNPTQVSHDLLLKEAATVCARRGHLTTLRWLNAHGAAHVIPGRMAVHNALIGGHVEVVCWLYDTFFTPETAAAAFRQHLWAFPIVNPPIDVVRAVANHVRWRPTLADFWDGRAFFSGLEFALAVYAIGVDNPEGASLGHYAAVRCGHLPLVQVMWRSGVDDPVEAADVLLRLVGISNHDGRRILDFLLQQPLSSSSPPTRRRDYICPPFLGNAEPSFLEALQTRWAIYLTPF